MPQAESRQGAVGCVMMDAGSLPSKELGKARSRCRTWMLRLTKHLSPLSVYVAQPDASEPLGLIALNAGVQTGVSPFALRQALLTHASLTDEALTVYFSSLLPFALVHLSTSARASLPLVTGASEMEIEVENTVGTVCMIRTPNLWAAGSSPSGGLSLLYLLWCRVDAVLNALRHVFQPPTVGVDATLFCETSPPAEAEEETAMRLLNCEAVREVPGVYIVREFITQREHDAIWSELKGPAALGLEFETLARRKVAHFNRKFCYGINQLGAGGDSVNARPAFFEWMRRRLKNEDLACKLQDYPAVAQAFLCDQLTVNFYECKGTDAPGIAHHVDAHSACMDCVFVVSLGSHTVLEYSRHDLPPEVAAPVGIFAAPRSLLLMTGEARYSWTHGIAEKRVDILSDRIPPLRRGDRVSLTWRRGREAPHLRADCVCKELCDGT
ncbi:oxidoreductase [Trypanosoma rangeli]|uniref:Oxidoreductase n=1 Tax=Trypanosoma rangeli TaxID=5698 RepID=A0A422NVI3_TRYRA|nr:oxidoreductase [Trypanosoma rangeli]RNF09459.1 oxidoreductase [Trypanosoma rangeli]|eukprot:RNF09459.1 oxidoreductase [Trypanosoma rangeli]